VDDQQPFSAWAMPSHLVIEVAPHCTGVARELWLERIAAIVGGPIVSRDTDYPAVVVSAPEFADSVRAACASLSRDDAVEVERLLVERIRRENSGSK
jgi:hypothetical protein